MSKTLICILAQTRAHELTFDSFYKNLLIPYNADLCLAIGSTSNQYKTKFHDHAKYIFEFNEPTDYMLAYKYVQKIEKANDDWVNILNLKDQLFGGIINLQNQHPGSAGILIFYRWWLLHNLYENKIFDQYDWFIITRSDYFYEFNLNINLIPEKIFIPEGEDYGGLTDRHIIVHKTKLTKAIDLMTPIMHETDLIYNEMCHDKKWNLEKYIKFIFNKRNILNDVIRFPRNMYAVRGQNDGTRWAKGRWCQSKQYYIKYMSEYNQTIHNFNRLTK